MTNESELRCPSCGSNRVTVTEETKWMVNTMEHWCHSVKAHDADARADCLACHWQGIRAQLTAAQPAPVVPDGWRIEMAPQWSETRLRVMPPGEPHYLLLEPGSMNEAGGVLYALCRAMIAASQRKGVQHG